MDGMPEASRLNIPNNRFFSPWALRALLAGDRRNEKHFDDLIGFPGLLDWLIPEGSFLLSPSHLTNRILIILISFLSFLGALRDRQ